MTLSTATELIMQPNVVSRGMRNTGRTVSLLAIFSSQTPLLPRFRKVLSLKVVHQLEHSGSRKSNTHQISLTGIFGFSQLTKLPRWTSFMINFSQQFLRRNQKDTMVFPSHLKFNDINSKMSQCNLITVFFKQSNIRRKPAGIPLGMRDIVDGQFKSTNSKLRERPQFRIRVSTK